MAASLSRKFDPVAFHVRFRPRATACIDLATGETLTYRAFSDRATACAHILVKRIGAATPGACVAILAQQCLSDDHLDGVEVVALVGREIGKTQEAAARYGVAYAFTDLDLALPVPGVDAVILATPTQMHAAQAIACMKAGKHVQVEIPLADSWADAEAVMAMQKKTGLVCMVGHTRRFNPSHQYIHKKIVAGEAAVLQMDVQTYFFRRTNVNALGQPRSWTNHLLWHHAAHTVYLFAYQTQDEIVAANALEGPRHPELGIAMDMSIQLKTRRGAICTLSLSFNNDGPLGTFFRYICDTRTWIACYDDLVTGKEEKVDVSNVDVSVNGIELQDREFFAAIREGREPNASVAQVLPCDKFLHQLDRQLSQLRQTGNAS